MKANARRLPERSGLKSTGTSTETADVLISVASSRIDSPLFAPSEYPTIHSIFVGQPKTITDERGTWTSSIYRDCVEGPVPVQKGGLAGDKVAQPYHGGSDADVCVHLLDHYRFWNRHYGMSLGPGNVGESLIRATATRMTQMQGLADWWKRLVIEKRDNIDEHWTTTMKEIH